MTPGADDLSPRTFVVGLLIVLALATAVRFAYPLADPPWRATSGIVWHDEGAWTHNARNKALFGEWRLDDWNPMYVAPVFTGLEYLSFAAFGVGLWQARLVSELTGLLSVLLLALAVRDAGGRRAGLMAGTLLATNYVYVMWNRAALLETTMVAFLVVGLWAYVRALRQPWWGLVAGLAAWLAFFSKAAAAFFLPALALAAVWPLALGWVGLATNTSPEGRRHDWQVALWVGGGLVLGAALGVALFVGPGWQEYWFYNWQMSVTRKPSYTLRAIADRLSWFPILHDAFTRMWAVLVVSAVVLLGRVLRWRSLPGIDRLLVAWIVVGVAELLAHDVGNERRFVFLIPAMCALTALALGRDGTLLPRALAEVPRRRALLIAPVLAYVAYSIVGPLGRLPFLYEVRPAVRLTAVAAAVLAAAVYLMWARFTRWGAAWTIAPRMAVLMVGLVAAGDLAQFGQWAVGRTYRNYAALRLVAERLPAGTLVHGKLANGLALESRIRPVFVGRGFGNYDDRLTRDDIEYVLTYISPDVGYEGPVIVDVLRAYPERRVLWTTPVAETTCGCDAVALIAKHVTAATVSKPVLALEDER